MLRVKKRKPTLEDLYTLAEDFAHRSIYYITYYDIMSHFGVSYSTATKMMRPLIRNYDFESEGTKEVHFVHPDYHEKYLNFSKKQLEEEKHHTKHVKKLADIRSWNNPILIEELQIKLVSSSSSLSRKIYKRFENTEYKKHSSVVIPLDQGADQYKFIIYPTSVNMYVKFFNGLELDQEKLKTLFDVLRRKVLNLYGNFAYILHIPLSFLVIQVYILRKSFNSNKPPCIKGFTKDISLTLSEIIPYLNDK